jgi:YVTN family beta-propeller protein
MHRQRMQVLLTAALALLWSARSARADLCAYVANSGSDYISVIDVATLMAVADIQVDGSPQSIGVDQAGYLYVVRSDGQRVAFDGEDDSTTTHLSILNSATYDVVRDVPVPICSDRVVVRSDGAAAYLADYCEGSIAFVDTRGGFPRSVPIPGDLYFYPGSVRLALAENASLLYVPLPEGEDGRIAVVDTESASVAEVFTIPLPDVEVPMASAIALSPDGHNAYVLLASAPVLPIVDTAAQTVTGVVQASGASLALTPDGSRLYVAASGMLRIVDLNTRVVTTLTLAKLRSPVALAPAENALLIADSSSQTVAVVDTATQLLRTQVPVGVGPRDIAIGHISGPCRPPDYTPRPTATPTPTSTATPTKVPLPQCPEGLPCMSVSSATGRRGDDLPVEVRLHPAGRTIAGTQNDILWDSGVSLHSCTAGGPSVRTSTSYSASSLRALVFGDSVQPITDGTVLYTCTLTIARNAALGEYYLRTVRILGTDPAGEPVNVVGADGTVLVVDQTEPQPQAASLASGGCAIGGGPTPQWLFSLALVLPPLLRLLRSCLRRSR